MKRTSFGSMLVYVLIIPQIAEASPPPAYVGVDLYTAERPPGASDFYVGSGWGGNPAAAGQIIGWFGYPETAVAWNPPSGTPVNLHPTNLLGYLYSFAHGTDGVSQVGHAYNAMGIQHGMMWHGTADSAIDLHPTSPGLTFVDSVAVGVSGNQQVGSGAVSPSGRHAILWNGTPESAVDLHPTLLDPSLLGGIFESVAVYTDGAQQVGFINRTTVQSATAHAVVWNGTPESAVDLNPAGATYSHAGGVAAGQQVGWALYPRGTHAMLWTGTAASAVSLNPTNLSGYGGSVANATDGVHQVGEGFYLADNTLRALLWTGSANSAVDLHALLPPGFRSSTAYSIDADGTIWGLAVAITTHAVKWTPAPEPHGFVLAVAALIGVARLSPSRDRLLGKRCTNFTNGS